MVGAHIHSTVVTGKANELGTDRVRGELHIQVGGPNAAALIHLVDGCYRQADVHAARILDSHTIQEATVASDLPSLNSVTVRAIAVPDAALDGHTQAVNAILLDAGRAIADVASVQDPAVLRAERFLDDLVRNRDGLLVAMSKDKAGIFTRLMDVLMKAARE